VSRSLAIVALLAGCGNLFGLEEVVYRDPGDGGIDDGGKSDDGAPDAAPNCYAGDPQGYLTICVPPEIENEWTPPVSPDVVDTGALPNSCEATVTVNGQELCVIVGKSITINAPLVTRGSRPLVIVATSQFTVTAQGTVLANSESAGRKAPGANFQGCNSSAGGSSGSGNGGGAGGSFSGTGGPGGKGNQAAVAGGAPIPPVLPPYNELRGGCRGGHGGGASGSGSDSGGAIYVIAQDSISISGVINASGAGGLAMPLGGGGGGGSGGMIVLDAPAIMLNDAALVAHGGGGGGGYGTSNGTTGGDPTTANSYVGLGGGGGLGGGDGGDGSIINSPNGGLASDASSLGASGGGGGGGHGVIRMFTTIRSMLGTIVISPPAT
jgi:hypothetical protein